MHVAPTKGPISTRSCSDSGIAMATPDTPTTFTCSRDKGAFGKSLFLIADFVAPVSTRKGISRPSIVKVSLGSSRGFEVSNGNSDEVFPVVVCHKAKLSVMGRRWK